MIIIEQELIRRYNIEIKKRQGFMYKLKRFFKLISIYTIPNGIFHRNEIKFDSNIARIGSILLYTITALYLYYKLRELDQIKSFNSYLIFKDYTSKTFGDIKIIDGLARNQKPINDGKDTEEKLLYFPFYLYGHNTDCNGGVNFYALWKSDPNNIDGDFDKKINFKCAYNEFWKDVHWYFSLED